MVRVAAYFRDLDLSLDSLLDGVQPGGVMLWTLANRSVGGERIPLVEALPELIGNRAEMVVAIERKIPQSRKSMPPSNSIADTIRAETIVVLRSTGRSMDRGEI
jgi:hypothetical protein